MLLRLSTDATAVRCVRCAASAITLSLVCVLLRSRPGFASEKVYELSARGALHDFLQRRVADFSCSEYFDDVEPGHTRDGVLCQDVQRLTFADESFDVCTSTEVMEHVADDLRAFREIRRVLRPGGLFLFTVPLSEAATVERARVTDGRLEHLLPAAYHGDRIRGANRVLVFRDYGPDITQRLRACGFARATVERSVATAFFGHGARVIVAER